MKAFQVGDRVRVYGTCQIGDVTCPPGGKLGTFRNYCDSSKTWANIDLDHGGRPLITFHAKQLRRLKPRKKQTREARVAWLYENGDIEDSLGSVPTKDTGEFDFSRQVKCTLMKPSNIHYIEFREVLPGETVITREKLAAAWDEHIRTLEGHVANAEQSAAFKRFAKAIGLKEGE